MLRDRKIVNLVSEMLGYPKRYGSGVVEAEFNCCKCDNGKNKFNLVVNVNKLVFKCWSCHYSGPLSRLVKDNGRGDQLSRYESISNLSSGRFYKPKKVDEELDLIDFRSLKFEWKDSINYRSAIKYLKGRRIGGDIITKWDICYSEHGEYANRIIIPSKNIFGGVDYFIARSFYKDMKPPYLNPELEKHKFIFGEKFIDWKKPVVLTEGVFDSIVLYNAVPILGKQIKGNTKLLQMLRVNKTPVIMGFDSDVTTSKKIEVAKYLMNLGIKVYSIDTTCYNDISEAYEKGGRKVIIEMIRNSVEFDELKMKIGSM